MASTVELWTPPPGMSGRVVADWRAFYRRALDLYGVTPERYLALYLAQKGRCWICRTATGKHPEDPKGRGGRRLGIDHNHTSGFVRGLLCTGGDKTCNRIIGWLTAPALHRAADYLDGTCTPGLIVGKYGDTVREEAALWPRETDAPMDIFQAHPEQYGKSPTAHKSHYGAPIDCTCKGDHLPHGSGLRGCIYGPGGVLDGRDPLTPHNADHGVTDQHPFRGHDGAPCLFPIGAGTSGYCDRPESDPVHRHVARHD